MPALTVRSLLIPVADYASISTSASVREGIQALEDAQRREIREDPTRHRDRALLAIDEHGDVAGKLSMWSILACLEPRFEHVEGAKASSRAASRVGSARSVIDAMMKDSHRWRNRLAVVAEKTGHLKVGDLVHGLREGELIDIEANLEAAVHQLTAGHYMSLLVTERGRIVGVLRLVDVYETVAALFKSDTSGDG